MTIRIKNWEKFQHYKNKQRGAHLPWIKLYRDLLDDLEWHLLSGDASKMLVMCWLIASDENGTLPPINRLAFRLRQSEKDVNRLLSTLSHWLEHDDSTTLAGCYQDDREEKEEEKEKSVSFSVFWKAYPKKAGKGAAEKAFSKINPNQELLDIILKAVSLQSKSDQWQKEGGQFIPHPATWLNQKRWEDEVESGGQTWQDKLLEKIQNKQG